MPSNSVGRSAPIAHVIAALIVPLAFDAFVSYQLHWKGIFGLIESAVLDWKLRFTLVGLAGALYVYTSVVLANSVAAVTGLPKGFEGVEAAAKAVSKALAGSPQSEQDALSRPLTAHRDLVKAKGDTDRVFSRLGPRDCLGASEFEAAMSNAVVADWRPKLAQADRVEGQGNAAAILGFAGTAAGLVACGSDLHGTMFEAAFSAALLKCFVGLMAKFVGVWARERVYDRARTEEAEVLAAVARSWGRS